MSTIAEIRRRLDSAHRKFHTASVDQADVIDILHLRPFCKERGFTFHSGWGDYHLGLSEDNREARYGSVYSAVSADPKDKELVRILGLLSLKDGKGTMLGTIIESFDPREKS